MCVCVCDSLLLFSEDARPIHVYLGDGSASGIGGSSGSGSGGGSVSGSGSGSGSTSGKSNNNNNNNNNPINNIFQVPGGTNFFFLFDIF